MCSGNSVGLIALLLPGADSDIGNKATLAGKFALCVGITQARRAQVVQGEIDYFWQDGLRHFGDQVKGRGLFHKRTNHTTMESWQRRIAY